MPSETCDTVENFLRDVDDQISCKLGLDSVNEELRAHIEDKMELYQAYGLDEEEACRRAVRDMGAPDVVGLELNRRHRLRTAKPLLFVILALMLAGFAGEMLRLGISWEQGIYWILADTISNVFYLKYYFWGLLALLVTARFGYPFLLKHTKGVCIVSMAVLAAVGGFWILTGLFPGVLDKITSNAPYFVHRLLGGRIQFVYFCGSRPAGRSGGGYPALQEEKGWIPGNFASVFLADLSGSPVWQKFLVRKHLYSGSAPAFGLPGNLAVSLCQGRVPDPKGQGNGHVYIKLLRPAGALGGAQVGQGEGESGAVRESGRPRFRHNRLG